jgi:hypothetical protein
MQPKHSPLEIRSLTVGGNAACSGSPRHSWAGRRYKNLIDATVQIYRTEGAAAFMSGWQPRLIWISLGGFVFFPVLEAAKKFYTAGFAEKEA